MGNLEIKGREEGKPNEVSEESETEEAEIAIIGRGGNIEIPPDTEMQAATVNKVRETRNSAKEVAVLQYLSILEYIAVNNAEEWIWKNEDVLSVQEHYVSKIEDTNIIRELFMAFSENAPTPKNEKQLAIEMILQKRGRKV